MASSVAGQLPFPFPVSVSTTEPLAMSFIPGVYMGRRAVASSKEPSPAVAHDRELVLEALGVVPEAARSRVVPSHISSSDPASTIGAGVMVNFIASSVAGQLPFPFPVSVSTTEPLAMSFIPGVYMGRRAVASSKEPSPAVAHDRELVLEALGVVPEAARSRVAPSQISSSDPASTNGKSVIVRSMLSIASGQFVLEAVSVRVTVLPTSKRLGSYIALSAVASVKLPLPLCVHNRLSKLLAIAPVRV